METWPWRHFTEYVSGTNVFFDESCCLGDRQQCKITFHISVGTFWMKYIYIIYITYCLHDARYKFLHHRLYSTCTSQEICTWITLGCVFLWFGTRLFSHMFQDDVINYRKLLAHWRPNKMATIFQTILLNTFSRTKMYEFRLKYHWRSFLRVYLT